MINKSSGVRDDMSTDKRTMSITFGMVMTASTITCREKS